MARRVAPTLARKAADAAYSEVDEVALIEKFLGRKYRGKNLGELLADQKHLASAYRKLRLAGFSSGEFDPRPETVLRRRPSAWRKWKRIPRVE